MKTCLALNKGLLPSTHTPTHPDTHTQPRMDVRRLVWGKGEEIGVKNEEEKDEEEDKFDLMLGADILFFEAHHQALLQTLDRYLRHSHTGTHTHSHTQGAEAWFLQPSRGGSLERFVASAREEEEEDGEGEGEG